MCFFSNLFNLLSEIISRNDSESHPCVYDIFNSEFLLELYPEVLALSPGTSVCANSDLWMEPEFNF